MYMSPTPKPRTENPGSTVTFEATLLEGCLPLTTPVTAIDYADGPFCTDLCTVFGFSSSGCAGTMEVQLPSGAGHSLSKGSRGPGGSPGHRLGRAGHPVF